MGMGMLNADQVTRIANAVHALRSDWHPNGLRAVLADRRLRDLPAGTVAVVLVAVAVDPASEKPTRVFEAGPWWHTVRPADRPNTTPGVRVLLPDDCHDCGGPRRAHPTANGCTYADPVFEPVPIPDDLRAVFDALRVPPAAPDPQEQTA